MKYIALESAEVLKVRLAQCTREGNIRAKIFLQGNYGTFGKVRGWWLAVISAFLHLKLQLSYNSNQCESAVFCTSPLGNVLLLVLLCTQPKIILRFYGNWW